MAKLNDVMVESKIKDFARLERIFFSYLDGLIADYELLSYGDYLK